MKDPREWRIVKLAKEHPKAALGVGCVVVGVILGAWATATIVGWL